MSNGVSIGLHKFFPKTALMRGMQWRGRVRKQYGRHCYTDTAMTFARKEFMSTTDLPKTIQSARKARLSAFRGELYQALDSHLLEQQAKREAAKAVPLRVLPSLAARKS